MADAAVWITGSGPDKQLNFRLPTGGIGPQGPKGADGSNVLPTDTAIKDAINNSASQTRAALNTNYASADKFNRAAPGGTHTDGDNIKIGTYAISPAGIATTFVQGGAANYENVIGGTILNIGTTNSNATGAAALVAPNGNWSAIIHGYDNVNNGWANILAGFHNYMVAGSNHGTIAGGSGQKIQADVGYATISGGTGNNITATQGTISGGSTNTVSGISGTVSGGTTNTAAGVNTTVGGGSGNSATGTAATIGGGSNNTTTSSTATVAGGGSNQASNISATVGGGNTNIASGNGATISGGLTNTASGTSSTILGGRDNTASASYSTAWGRDALADTIGGTSYANGKFAAQGDAQAENYVLRKETTDATSTSMFADGVGTHMPIRVDSTIAFEILIVARRTDADGESAAYKITGCADRGAGSTAALVGTPVITELSEDNAGWGVTITAATSGTLRVAVTGEVGKTIRWVGRASIVNVTG